MKGFCRKGWAVFCALAVLLSAIAGYGAFPAAAAAPSPVINRADFMDVNFIRGFEDNGPLQLSYNLYGGGNKSKLVKSAELNRQVLSAHGWINYPVTGEMLKTITDQMTLEIAFKLPAGRSGTECLGGNLESGGIGVEITKEGKLTVFFGLPAGGYTKLETQVEAQKWYHLVASYDKAGEAVLYLNDQKITAVPSNGNSIKHNLSMPWMSIGANTVKNGNGIYTFHGEMALFRIYKKASSAQRAHDLYAFFQNDPAYETVYHHVQELKTVNLADKNLNEDYVTRVNRQIADGEALIVNPAMTVQQAADYQTAAQTLLSPLRSVQVTRLPDQTEYLKDREALNLRGGKLTLTHENGAAEVVDLDKAHVTGFDNRKPGKQTLTATYNGVSAPFEVTVVARRLASIAVTRLPDQTVYEANTQQLNLTGGVLTLTYSDGSREERPLSDAKVTGFDSGKPGKQTLNAALNGKTAVFSVTVVKGTDTVLNTRTGLSFGALDEAMAQAASGDTLQLLKDSVIGDLMLHNNLSLDLNGHRLSAAHLVAVRGSAVKDEVGSGLLAVAQDRLILPEENPQISVWNGRDGFVFRSLNLTQKQHVDLTYNQNEGMLLLFKPVFGTRAFETAMFADGCKDNLLHIQVEFSWDSVTQSAGHQTFIYGDSLVQWVYEKPNRGLALRVRSIQNLPNLRACLVVESESGVRVSAPILNPVQ